MLLSDLLLCPSLLSQCKCARADQMRLDRMGGNDLMLYCVTGSSKMKSPAVFVLLTRTETTRVLSCLTVLSFWFGFLLSVSLGDRRGTLERSALQQTTEAQSLSQHGKSPIRTTTSFAVRHFCDLPAGLDPCLAREFPILAEERGHREHLAKQGASLCFFVYF